MEQFGFPHRNPSKDGFICSGVCRQFINGSCSFGSRCQFLHQWPALPSTQICRYFQKGGCWFGESCRYLHVLQPHGETSSAGRRGSAPVAHSSVHYYRPTERRGSAPSLPQAQGFNSQYRWDSESSLQQGFEHVTTNIAEEEAAEAAPPPQQDSESDQRNLETQSIPPSPSLAQAGTALARQQEDETSGSQAGAAAPSEQSRTEAYIQSEDVTCGICMDKVYEKTSEEERRFGILPSCNHPFCLGCIITWRKTKNFQEDVIKGCPQCRVKSAFYVPSKYWVEGQPKETLIANFKEKCSKRRCGFFMRQGCCPFKRECLYRHELPPGYSPPRRRRSPRSRHAVSLEDLDSLQLLDYVITMTLLDHLSDEDDDDLSDDHEYYRYDHQYYRDDHEYYLF